MATASLQYLVLVCLFTFHVASSSISQTPYSPNNQIIFPVTKDVSTHQYKTKIYMGTPQEPVDLVVDLGGPFLWVACHSRHVSSSHHPIHCATLQCSMAKPTENGGADCFSSTRCGLCPENSVTNMATLGDLAEEIVSIGGPKTGSAAIVPHFLFSCAPTSLLTGLPAGVKGILGLGRSRIALPSQLAKTFGFQRKFAMCLSSSSGVIFSGSSPYVSDCGTDISKSLMYTPLVTNQGTELGEEYCISVKSIKINGKKLSLAEIGGAKLSTVVAYTTMQSTIYDTFVKAYAMMATSMNMSRVAPMAPFGVCFSSKGIKKTSVGTAVPTVDLVLQSEMVKWRISGRNLMVDVTDEVMCLGFLDGGSSPQNSIVLGGHQLEDNLLEFNLATSMLGFSSSLLMRETSCSNFRLQTMSSESI